MPTLDFKGKQLVYAHHLTVSARTLKIDAKKSTPPPPNQDWMVISSSTATTCMRSKR